MKEYDWVLMNFLFSFLSEFFIYCSKSTEKGVEYIHKKIQVLNKVINIYNIFNFIDINKNSEIKKNLRLSNNLIKNLYKLVLIMNMTLVLSSPLKRKINYS